MGKIMQTAQANRIIEFAERFRGFISFPFSSRQSLPTINILHSFVGALEGFGEGENVGRGVGTTVGGSVSQTRFKLV